MDDFRLSRQDNTMALEFSSAYLHIDRAIEELLAFVEGLEVSIQTFDMNLILREGLNNAVEHGNKLDQARHVRCVMTVETDRLSITIEDEGEGFDWQYRQSGQIDARTARGKGLLLMEAYGFQVVYNTKGNILHLCKELV